MGAPIHKEAVLTSLFCGLLLGLGIAIGGMADGRRTSSFFNAALLTTELWDPTLAIMFTAALVTNAMLYYSMVNNALKKPIFAGRFSIPTSTALTYELKLGSSLFGAGWAMGGFCPGPAVVASINGDQKVGVFLMFMFIGMAVFKYGATLRFEEKKGFSTAVANISLVVYLAVLFLSKKGADVENVAFKVNIPQSIGGGILVGASTAIMMIFTGEILGIAGILNGLFDPTKTDKVFRLAFLSGLVLSGVLSSLLMPETTEQRLHRSWFWFALGGFMVGYGTSLGSGCTSGHGICGLTRGSPRSILAVAIFFLSNFLVTTTLYLVAGVGTGWIPDASN